MTTRAEGKEIANVNEELAMPENYHSSRKLEAIKANHIILLGLH
jgi:hypothetical protein